MIKTISLFLLSIILLSVVDCLAAEPVRVKGELKKWHKVTLVIEGPKTAEWAKENPFLNYRLEATFINGDKTYKVPGFFAADENVAENSAEEGNIWLIHFRPSAIGTWNYKISFQHGENIVVRENSEEGKPVEPDGFEGSFEIKESDKIGNDFRSMGRIVNGGKGYFSFQENGKTWIKNGTDSPENFLAYYEFDQTSRFSLKSEVREGEADPKKDLHKYEPHVEDWKEGDPTWQTGKGKGIIGAVNYLASAGINSAYMLTMNIMGDGKDVWPYTDHNERYRFDCSKLAQWEIVFDHMEKSGLMMHFVLQETENECLLDIGQTDVQRKLYLRELVARFGHHLAVTWNLGEENGPANWTPIGQTDEQRKAMATYLKAIHPYENIVVLHTHANKEHQRKYLTPLLGFENLDGPSMQIGNPFDVNDRIKEWVEKSEEAGKRWLVNLDEIGQHWKGVMPDSYDAAHDTVRQQCLWGSLLAGATGAEWYFGYRYPHTDLTCEDFRSRKNWWEQTAIATNFMNTLPVEKMAGNNHLVSKGYCFTDVDEIYVVYTPEGQVENSLHIEGDDKYTVQWFNPRVGGKLQKGSKNKVSGPGKVNLGIAPGKDNGDWVILVKRTQ